MLERSSTEDLWESEKARINWGRKGERSWSGSVSGEGEAHSRLVRFAPWGFQVESPTPTFGCPGCGCW